MAQIPAVKVGVVVGVSLVLEKGKMETLTGWVACPRSESVVGLTFGFPVWRNEVTFSRKRRRRSWDNEILFLTTWQKGAWLRNTSPSKDSFRSKAGWPDPLQGLNNFKIYPLFDPYCVTRLALTAGSQGTHRAACRQVRSKIRGLLCFVSEA